MAERSEAEIAAAINAQRGIKASAEATRQNLIPAYEAQAQAVAVLEGRVADQERAVARAQGAVERATATLDAHKRKVDEAQASYDAQKRRVDDATVAYDQQNRKVGDAERAYEQQNRKVGDAQRAYEGAKKAVDDATAALEAQNRKVEDAQRALTLQERTVRDAQRALEDHTGAVTDAQRAYDDQNRVLQDAQRAYDDHNRFVEEATRQYEAARQHVEDATDAYNTQKDAVDDLTTAYANAKREVGEITQQFNAAISQAKEHAQALRDAKKAADELAKAEAGKGLNGESILPEGAKGVDPQTAEQAAELQKQAEQFAKDVERWRKEAEQHTNAVGGFFDRLGTRARQVQADLQPHIDQLRAQYGPALQTLYETVKDRLGPALDLLGRNATPILAGIGAALLFLGSAAVVGAIIAVVGAMTPIAGIAIAIGAATFGLTKAWTENWFDIQGKTETAWRVIGPILGRIAEALEGFRLITVKFHAFDITALDDAKNAVGGAKDVALEQMREWGRETDKWLIAIGDSFKREAPKWAQYIKDESLRNDTVIETAVEGWKRAFVTKLGEIGVAIKTATWDWAGKLIQGWVEGLAAKEVEGDKALTEWVQGLIDSAKRTLGIAEAGAQRFFDIAGQTWQGFADGLAANVEAAHAGVTGFFQTNVIDAVKGLLGLGGGEGGEGGGEGGGAGGVFGQIASDAIQGFLDGVTAWAEDAGKNIKGFFEGIIAEAKKTLGIESPSTVFKQIGSDTIQGLWDGIADRAAQFFDDVKTWVEDNLLRPVREKLNISEAGQPAGAFVQMGLDTVAGLVKGLQDATGWIVEAARELARLLIEAARNKIAEDANSLRDAVVDVVKAAIEAAQKFANENPIVTTIKNVVQTVAGAAGSAASAAGSTVQSAAQAGFDWAAHNKAENDRKAHEDRLRREGRGAGGEPPPILGGDLAAIAGPKAQQALAKALSMVGGGRDYIGWCQRFVENMFGTSGRFATAWTAAQAITSSHSAAAPAGTMVFFRPHPTNAGAGHVGISLGDGRFVSATNSGVTIDSLNDAYWRGLYHGHGVAPFAKGGWITEPIFGVGASGQRYTFGEKESELIVPRSKVGAVAPGGATGQGGDVHHHYHLTFTGAVFGKDVEDVVVDAIGNAQRRGRL